jgi:hypothetical protein
MPVLHRSRHAVEVAFLVIEPHLFLGVDPVFP